MKGTKKNAMIDTTLSCREAAETKFFLQQSAEPGLLFSVMDGNGRPVYRVTGDSLALGSKVCFLDQNELEVARVFSVGLAAIAKYSVMVGEKERARVTWNLRSERQPIKIKGVKWRFRGDLITRSYDLVDEDAAVVLTHGRCWNRMGDCYAVEVAKGENALIGLCISVILDSTVLTGPAAALSPT